MDMADLMDGGGNTEQLHVMDIEYREQFGDPITYLFCRARDGTRRWVEVEGHKPSFYIDREAYTQRVKNHEWVEDAEGGYESIHGKDLARIYTELPWHISGKRDKKGLDEYFDQTWEADVFYTTRFLIDNGIYTHIEVDKDETWESQYMSGDYRVHVDDIEAVDPDWRAKPRQVTVDIEVESPDGFPEPDEAEQPVTAITAHDNYSDEYTVWVFRHDSWDHTDTEIQNMVVENRPDTITTDGIEHAVNVDDVRVFSDESAMLHDFNQYVEKKRPDMLGGWNSSTTDNGKPFDYPYLINRCQSHNIMSYEDWSPMGQVWDGNWGPDGKGIVFFDMMKAYKKTQWQKPKGGYGLENTANRELGFGKEAIDDIDSAWRDEPELFLKYNMRDVQAVIGIDHSAGVTELFQNIRKLTGVQFDNCHNPIDTLDPYIIRFANENGLALPTNEKPDRSWFYGGHNFIPEFGRHKNAVYPDVWSEYPNAFRTVNMSPETIIGTKEDLEASEYTEEDCRWSYIDTRSDNVKQDSSPEKEKCYYLKPSIKTGFMNRVVQKVMGLKDDYDGTDLYGPVKMVVNAVWGIYGDSDSYGKGYRLFDWRVAESITLYGQTVIKNTASNFVDELNNIKEERGYDGQNAYLVGGDTDSVMSSVPYIDIEDRDDMREVIDIAHEACERTNDWYEQFAEEAFNCEQSEVGENVGREMNGKRVAHYIELEIESYAPWLFIPEPATKDAEGKKRYAEIIAWEEGEWFDPAEFSVTGIDVVRSDRADITRDVCSDVLEYILRIDDHSKAREAIRERIKDTYDAAQRGEVSNAYIARPKGMSMHPEEYGSSEQLPSTTYRGAKYANKHFDWEHMDEGSKPQLLHIDTVRGDWPKTYTAETKEDGMLVDAVSVENPNKVPDEFIIDMDTQLEKTIESSLTPILSAMDWDYDEMVADSQQAGIGEFM